MEQKDWARLALHCEIPSDLSVRELAEFLYDLNILYDRIVMLFHEPQAPVIYSPNFYRRWRRLKPGQQLNLVSINTQSPLKIEIKIDPAAVIAEARKLFLDILRLILYWKHERRMQTMIEMQQELIVQELRKRVRYLSTEALIQLAWDTQKLMESRVYIAKVKE